MSLHVTCRSRCGQARSQRWLFFAAFLQLVKKTFLMNCCIWREAVCFVRNSYALLCLGVKGNIFSKKGMLDVPLSMSDCLKKTCLHRKYDRIKHKNERLSFPYFWFCWYLFNITDVCFLCVFLCYLLQNQVCGLFWFSENKTREKLDAQMSKIIFSLQ